jgi:hypothetical protein
MENEEKYIREKVGQKNPFTVPEGYFDQLTSQVMSQLPERRQKSRVVQLRKWFYAAACVAAVAVMGLTYHFHQQADDQTVVASVDSNTDNSYIDEAADYAMLDNTEIYAYLAEN